MLSPFFGSLGSLPLSPSRFNVADVALQVQIFNKGVANCPKPRHFHKNITQKLNRNGFARFSPLLPNRYLASPSIFFSWPRSFAFSSGTPVLAPVKLHASSKHPSPPPRKTNTKIPVKIFFHIPFPLQPGPQRSAVPGEGWFTQCFGDERYGFGFRLSGRD